MRTRKDGEETRRNILTAACRVFSEKGFHEATHAEICRLAGVNNAAINYHFDGKEELYRAVWKHTIELMHDLYPVDADDAHGLSGEEKLLGFVTTLLRKMTDHSQLGWSHRLHLQEISHPTGMIDDLLKKSRMPYQQYLLSIIRELLGDKATNDAVRYCEKSIVGQVRTFRFGLNDAPQRNWKRLSEKQLRMAAEHITRFSLAGIDATRRAIG